MSLGRIAGAAAFFVTFACMAVAMGHSAWSDWREGRQKGDKAIMFYAARQWWPALLSAVMAVVAPVAMLFGR